MSITNLIKSVQSNLNSTVIANEELTMNAPIVTNEAAIDFGFEEVAATTSIETKEATMNDIKLSDLMNTNALSSTITASIFHELGNPQQAVLAGCAIVDAIELSDNMGIPEAFFGMVESTLESATLKSVVSGNGQIATTTHEVPLDIATLHAAMKNVGFVNDDNTMGARLIQILEQRTEAYKPTLVGTPWVRRFPLYAKEKGQAAPLAIEAIEALEATQYTIDANMVCIANQVQVVLGLDNDDEGYVLTGCNEMSAHDCYTSEFKADARIRLYQAACHGPNGQASDRSRAMMDLANVPMDYDIPTVQKAIRAEVMDMVSVSTDKIGKLMTLAIKDPVSFIVAELAKPKKNRDAAKPWSFVKAAIIWNELQKGNRPYIGMAVGLDAKCSGPQLGALMSGDAEVAAACGFTLVQMEDAYHRAIRELQNAGFNFTMAHRNLIKKPFMGIFYGQGWAAFTNLTQMKKDEQEEIISILFPSGVANDDVAKAFHKAITKSFGKKMVAVRNRFKEYAEKVSGRIAHYMPDGSKVAMNYKVRVNILGEAIEHDVVCPDVTVTTENNTYKFIKMGLKTREVHTGDFVRNGFVNMIQATDALIARLIIVHLKRLGAQHIISVHDCFRVNVTEMHLLEQAIKNAYMDLFGTRTNTKTEDLPMGTDILAMYFEGANLQINNGEEVTPIKQFMPVGNMGEVRKMMQINRVSLPELIQALGTSYYFAK